jgi:hypothetical protein
MWESGSEFKRTVDEICADNLEIFEEGQELARLFVERCPMDDAIDVYDSIIDTGYSLKEIRDAVKSSWYVIHYRELEWGIFGNNDKERFFSEVEELILSEYPPEDIYMYHDGKQVTWKLQIVVEEGD